MEAKNIAIRLKTNAGLLNSDVMAFCNPTIIIMLDIAFVTDISGACKAGVTCDIT